MHRALHVPDIIIVICSFLRRDGTDFNASGKSALCSLARSCKPLSGHALDALYADLGHLYPLIMCLPPDLVRCEEVGQRERRVGFKRPMKEADWTIWSRYSTRVKVLTIDRWLGSAEGAVRIASSVYDALCCRQGCGGNLTGPISSSLPLFPSIREIRWTAHYQPSKAQLAFLDALCSSPNHGIRSIFVGEVNCFGASLARAIELSSNTLQCLWLHSGVALFPGSGHCQEFGSMLVEILPKLQKLEALRFDYFGMHDPRPSGEILDAASSLPRLRILDLVPLPKFDVSEIQKGPGSVVLRTIGRFGNLSIGNSSAGVLSTARQLSRRLDLTSPFATGPPSSFKGEKGGPEWKVTGIPSDALEDSMFPDLEHLCVRGVISDFQGLLSYTGPFPSMSQLKLDIRNIEDANSFFCIITSSFSADTLTELKVILDGPPRVMGSRKLNQEVFAPLAAFSRLSKLTIRCSDTFSLSGQAVIHISKSWPMLRALSIDGQGSGHINFNDLEILLANCALLEFMHIPLLSEGSPIASSSSVLVNSSPLAPSSVRSERVMRLELYGSLIEDPQSTAARLAGMLPRLQFISCSGGFSTRLFAKKSWDKLKVSWLETENCLRELISERERF